MRRALRSVRASFRLYGSAAATVDSGFPPTGIASNEQMAMKEGRPARSSTPSLQTERADRPRRRRACGVRLVRRTAARTECDVRRRHPRSARVRAVRCDLCPDGGRTSGRQGAQAGRADARACCRWMSSRSGTVHVPCHPRPQFSPVYVLGAAAPGVLNPSDRIVVLAKLLDARDLPDLDQTRLGVVEKHLVVRRPSCAR